MKTLRLFLVLPLLAGEILAGETAAGGPVLPEKIIPQLEPILAAAVQQSPRMLNRVLDLEIAENNRIQARANVLPSVGGWASYYDSRDTRADLTGPLNVIKIAYNLSVNQPVFYWGERRNNARMGEIQASIAKGQFQDGYRALAQTLRGDYMRLIVQKLSVKRAVAYQEYTKDQLQKEETRLAQKVISEFQIFPIRLAAEQAQIASERAQFDFEMAKVSFVRLSGQPLLDDAIPDTIPVAAYEAAVYDRQLADYLGQKEPPTMEAVIMRKQLENEKLNYLNQTTRLKPKFNAVLGASQDQQSYTLNVAQKYRVNSLFGGVSASWTIFDGFSSQAAVRSEIARKRQMENDYKDLTERLAQQAQTQVKQLNFSARSMVITDRAMVASEGNLKTKQDEFARGVCSEDDVSWARIALMDAQINAYNGRSDYLYRIGDFLGTVMTDPVVANVAANK
jgi:outer membrane protein TolC